MERVARPCPAAAELSAFAAAVAKEDRDEEASDAAAAASALVADLQARLTTAEAAATAAEARALSFEAEVASAKVRRCKLKPVQPVLKVSGFSSSNLKTRQLLSNFAFNFNLRRYTKDSSADAMAAGRADLTLAERRLHLATSSTAAEIAQLKAWPNENARHVIHHIVIPSFLELR